MSKKVIELPVVVSEAQVDQTKNLYVQVTTYNETGKVIGTRIVDTYHFGTRNWLHNHTWWAMHNQHSVSIEVAHPDDVAAYLADAKLKLAEKFNKAA